MTMAEIIQILALLGVILNSLATLGVGTLIFLAAGRSGAPLPMPGRKRKERKEQQEEQEKEQVRTQERSEAGEILE